MARTRLRGLEIGGIQIGIEVPESCEWDWPDAPVSEFQCLPREPEVHVGIRVGGIESGDLGGELYSIGSWIFEVARSGEDWRLGLSRGGQRAQVALFDKEFLNGEIVISEEMAASRVYPLRGPLDEWIVLHRTVARGGLCLNASAYELDGEAILSLGTATLGSASGCHTPSSSLLGHSALLVREERDLLRLFRTPWSESIDSRLPVESRLSELQSAEDSEESFRNVLDPVDAAEILVRNAVVPLCDDALLERVMRNAQRIAQAVPVAEVGQAAVTSEAPMAWLSTQLQNAFAPPRDGF
jgi:hypothetical protein